MITARCTNKCYDNDLGLLYEDGKDYVVDETKPWNWRHFQFPREVDPPKEVLDMLGLSKTDAEASRGEKLPDKAAARKAAEAAKKKV